MDIASECRLIELGKERKEDIKKDILDLKDAVDYSKDPDDGSAVKRFFLRQPLLKPI